MRCFYSVIWTFSPLRSNFSPPQRSTLMKWRSSKWSLEMLAATGVRWRQKTSVTAPPLIFLWRVSENGLWPNKPAADSGHTDVLVRSRLTRSLHLLLQLYSKGSRQTFCLPSRGRKCAWVCVAEAYVQTHKRGTSHVLSIYSVSVCVRVCVSFSNGSI